MGFAKIPYVQRAIILELKASSEEKLEISLKMCVKYELMMVIAFEV